MPCKFKAGVEETKEMLQVKSFPLIVD